MVTYTYEKDFATFRVMMNAQIDLAATSVSSPVPERVEIVCAGVLTPFDKGNLDDYMMMKGYFFVSQT